MTDEEILRRVRALVAMPARKRPFPVDRLERVSGLTDDHIYKLARSGRMSASTAKRLGRALTLFENDQVVSTPVFVGRTKKPNRITIRAPQPPIERRMGIVFTKQGAKIEKRVVNPNAFPDFKD